jgi:hypothetical protein
MNQLDVCAHLSDLTNLYHDKLVYFGVPLFVIPHLESRQTGRGGGKMRADEVSLSLTQFPRLGGVVQLESGKISITVMKKKQRYLRIT